MNGVPKTQPALSRAAEVDDLIDAVKTLIIPYIKAADDAFNSHGVGSHSRSTTGRLKGNGLVDYHEPLELVKRLRFSLPAQEGEGKDGLLRAIENILQYSVNTWHQGFLDKLYASTNAVGVISELLLAVLNTNLHVYQVSPALTVIEKHTAKAFANLFGFTGPNAGGFTAQGGSASNLTSIIVARATLYPETKLLGNAAHHFVLFTSAHGHYSVEKAALACGLGTANVVAVPVDPAGRMLVSRLRELVQDAKAAGQTPLYVNATAGTTVLGSYDPFEEIAAVCREYGLWMHVDASWGGPVVFSRKHAHSRLRGVEMADSLTVNPHKMMGVPVTCSFLLAPDVGVLHRANTLPAGYLFHNTDDSPDNGDSRNDGEDASAATPLPEVWDLADLTMQCGRRGDSLKLALSWIYHGAAGFERQVDAAFDAAAHLASELLSRPDEFVLVSSNPPPCLQVCFYHAPLGGQGELSPDPRVNTRRTQEMVRRLIPRGFMIDYAPGERGSFFRVVVNCQTRSETVERLVEALVEVGREVSD